MDGLLLAKWQRGVDDNTRATGVYPPILSIKVGFRRGEGDNGWALGVAFTTFGSAPQGKVRLNRGLQRGTLLSTTGILLLC